jgi:hypothetical protein
MTENGGFKTEGSPASSLYHIICALGELAQYVGHVANLHLPVADTLYISAVGEAATVQAEF